MTDLVLTQGEGVPASMRTRYKDMEDGTHAIVIFDGSVELAGGTESVVVISVPTDPFGTNADDMVDAGDAGSIQAKLRRLTADLGIATVTLGDVKTILEVLGDVTEDNEIRVDIIAPLPAGDNTLGEIGITDLDSGHDLYIGRDGSAQVGLKETILDKCESLAGWTGSTDVTNLTLSTDHRGCGEYSIQFDKSGTTQAFALLQKVPDDLSVDARGHLTHSYINYYLYLSKLTGITTVYFALGTDPNNYWYWQTPVDELQVGWNHLHHPLSGIDGVEGDGCNLSNVEWIALYVGFWGPNTTLSNIRLDDVRLIRTMGVNVSDPHAKGYATVVRVSDDVRRIPVVPVISAGTAYASGDALGGKLMFGDAVRQDIKTGRITKVVVIDNAKQLAPLDLVLFDRTFTSAADNAPFDPTDADMQNCIGHLSVAAADYASFVNNSIATVDNISFGYTLDGTTLYGQMVVRGTPTYVATDDLTIILTVERD